MNTAQRIALVTGANKGIGFEVARELGRQGVMVYVGARDLTRGENAAASLRAEGIAAQTLRVDLNDHDSIRAAGAQIEANHGHLDILVNNAGIIDPADGVPTTTDVNTVRRTFETNFFGALVVSQTMLPLLKKSDAARIVNVSSGLGSLALNQDPEWPFASVKLIGYNASKAALNMLTVQLAWELRDTPAKVNSANPGYTDTDLVPGVVGAQPVSEGAKTPVRLALLPADGPTGGFFENEGSIPW